jgi:hypothetical protein
MKRSLLYLAMVLWLAAFVTGCGGDTGKGVHSGKDKPKPVQPSE